MNHHRIDLQEEIPIPKYYNFSKDITWSFTSHNVKSYQ